MNSLVALLKPHVDSAWYDRNWKRLSRLCINAQVRTMLDEIRPTVFMEFPTELSTWTHYDAPKGHAAGLAGNFPDRERYEARFIIGNQGFVGTIECRPRYGDLPEWQYHYAPTGGAKVVWSAHADAREDGWFHKAKDAMWAMKRAIMEGSP